MRMVYFAQIIIEIEPSKMRSPHALYNGFPIFHPSIQTILKEKDPTKWYTDMLSDIADIGDRVNHYNQFGEVPLGVAAYRGAGLVVEQLLVRPEIDVNLTGRRGRTPLYLAAEEGHVYIVKLLLKHPAIDVNKGSAPAGATALMAASRRGHGRVVELLLLHPNINTDKLDRDGNNAMIHARTTSIKHRLKGRDRSRSLQDIVIHSQMGRNIGANLANVATFLEAPISESNLPTLEVNHKTVENNLKDDNNDVASCPVSESNKDDTDPIIRPHLNFSISAHGTSTEDNKAFESLGTPTPTLDSFTLDSPRFLVSCPTSLSTSASSLHALSSVSSLHALSSASLHAPLVNDNSFPPAGRSWFHRLRSQVNNSLKACCLDVNRHNRKR